MDIASSENLGITADWRRAGCHGGGTEDDGLGARARQGLWMHHGISEDRAPLGSAAGGYAGALRAIPWTHLTPSSVIDQFVAQLSKSFYTKTSLLLS